MGRTAPGPLFGLAPNGVYRAASLTLGAVGSYPTFSPLLRQNGAVCFLWHCPSGRLEPSLPPFQEESCPVVSGLSSPATGPERISASWKITKGRFDHATTQKLYKLETCDHYKSEAIRKGRKGGSDNAQELEAHAPALDLFSRFYPYDIKISPIRGRGHAHTGRSN